MPILGFIGGIGPWELAIILVIVLIFFGAGKLPTVLESFGRGVKAFRDAQRDEAIDVSPDKRALSEDANESVPAAERSKAESGS